MHGSGLPRLWGHVTAACTYEGENTVLELQTARYLVKMYRQAKDMADDVPESVAYLASDGGDGSLTSADVVARGSFLAPQTFGVLLTARAPAFVIGAGGSLGNLCLGSTGMGRYAARPDDGLTLVDTRITNAVRCVPPENKPVGAEIANCRPFLANEIACLASLRVILALGTIAHNSVLAALGLRRAAYPFGHGAAHDLPNGLWLIASYHCSRYNTNTGRLTPAMFEDVFAAIRQRLDQA